MTEATFASGGQTLSGSSRLRSTGILTPARASNRTGSQETAFSNTLQNTNADANSALDRGITASRNEPIPGGSALLSTPVLFTLAETRTQEAEAASSFPAPSSLGRAIGSYAQTEASIRETIIGTTSLVER
jgi:hypothetical protein